MNVALKPAEEWPVIAAEQTTAAGLYTKYIVPLSAIGPVCAFLAAAMWGQRIPFTAISVRPAISGLFMMMIVGYLMGLILVAASALIVQKLAPTFKSQGTFVDALKMITFSYAPYWLVSVITLVPLIGMLSVLIALYGLYLFYVGLPHVMKTPDDQRLPYMGVVLVVSIVVWFVLMGLPAVMVGSMLWMNQ
jgi:hypothetical protein